MLPTLAFAGEGTYTITPCSSIPAPVTNKTWCFDTADGALKVYNGATYTTLTGSGGAPTDATYLTLGINGTLSNERVFVPYTGLAAIDGGAGGNYEVYVATTEMNDLLWGNATEPEILWTFQTNAGTQPTLSATPNKITFGPVLGATTAIDVPDSTVAGLSTATAGFVKRLSDGGATGALVIADGSNFECTEAKSQNIIIVTCPPHNLKGDGTDETTTLQTFLDSNKSATKTIIFPSGKTFGVASTIKVRGWDGGRILGYGAKFTWLGSSDPTCDQAAGQPECSAFIKLEASKAVTIEGFEFITSSNKPGYGIYISSYQPLTLNGAHANGVTRVDVNENPTLRRGFGNPSGTAYINTTDNFTYTGIGTSAGACGGVGPYCFTGVSGVSDGAPTWAGGTQVWFMENPKTPSNNVIKSVTVNGSVSVAAFQWGDNGYDYVCNSGNDEPWNVDANWGYNLAVAGTLPLWGFRQQSITSAGTVLEDSSRLAGTDADHNLACGNAVTIRGQEFGGNTATNGAFYISDGVGLVTIDASGDAELNEPFLKKATGTTGNVTILGALLRPGASASSGMKFIDWSGEGQLTLVGVYMSGRGATQTPDQVYVTTGGSGTVFSEQGVATDGVIYDVHANVKWTRTGDHSFTQSVGTGSGDKYRWNRLVNLRSGAGGDACFEWRDKNADASTAKTGLWRICHKGTSSDGYAYIQGAIPKYGLTLDGAVTTASTQINVSANPASYGFTNGVASAVIGGIEKSYWVTFDYTSTDTSCGGPSGCFKGVTNVSGYAPTATPVVAEWAQQASSGVIQEWHVDGTTVNQDLTMASAKSIKLPSDGNLWWSNDLMIVRDAANVLAQRNGTNGQTFRLYGTYTSSTNYERLSLEWDNSRGGYVIETEKGSGGGAQQHLFLNAASIRMQNYDAATPWFCIGTTGTTCYWNMDAYNSLVPANTSTNVLGSASKTFLDIFADNVKFPITGRPVKVWLPAAGCNNATAGTIWNLPTSNAPTPTCVGSTTRKGVLQFPDSDGAYAAYTDIALPSDFLATADVDAVVFWKTSSSTTSHTVVWQVALACAGDDDPFDPSFNTAKIISGDAKAAADDVIRSAGTNITKTACQADDIMNIKILRDRTYDVGGVTDDLVGTVDLLGVELTYRRTQ